MAVQNMQFINHNNLSRPPAAIEGNPSILENGGHIEILRDQRYFPAVWTL